MAVLGPRFCARAFPSCGKRGPLFIAMRGPLTIAASLVAEHRLQTCRLSNCGSRAQSLRGMWDLPRPGLEPVCPALAGRFSTTAPPGKPFPLVFEVLHNLGLPSLTNPILPDSKIRSPESITSGLFSVFSTSYAYPYSGHGLICCPVLEPPPFSCPATPITAIIHHADCLNISSLNPCFNYTSCIYFGISCSLIVAYLLVFTLLLYLKGGTIF